MAHGVLTALGAWMVYASTMVALADELELPDTDLDRDERVFLHDVPWEDYARLDRIRGESARPRLTYLDGELELMSPSNSHEGLKKCIARLLEVYADVRDLPLNGFGSWTLKSRRKKSAAEPDECYCLGPVGRVPDIAIEVVWTSGGISKLAVYARIGVPEVWMWMKGKPQVYALSGSRYVPIARSKFIPELDLDHLLEFVDFSDQSGAAKRYRASLRG